jgi:hypothetical protein
MAGANERHQRKIEALIADADDCGYYGQRYSEAKNLEELLACLGEAVCISAFRIADAVKPNRIQRLTKTLRWMAASGPKGFVQGRINMFATALFFVTDRLRLAFRSWASVPHPEMLADQSIFKGAEKFVIITGMSDEEKKNFFATMSSKMIHHLDDPPRDETAVAHRIVAQTARTVEGNVTARLIASAAFKNPLDLIEPQEFARQFKKLLS